MLFNYISLWYFYPLSKRKNVAIMVIWWKSDHSMAFDSIWSSSILQSVILYQPKMATLLFLWFMIWNRDLVKILRLNCLNIPYIYLHQMPPHTPPKARGGPNMPTIFFLYFKMVKDPNIPNLNYLHFVDSRAHV